MSSFQGSSVVKLSNSMTEEDILDDVEVQVINDSESAEDDFTRM